MYTRRVYQRFGNTLRVYMAKIAHAFALLNGQLP